MKRIISLLLVLAMLLSVLPAALAADPNTYPGQVLVAVNNDLSSDRLTTGRFSSTDLAAPQASEQTTGAAPVADVRNGLQILEPDLPELTPADPPADAPDRSLTVQAPQAAYNTSSTKVFTSTDNIRHNMRCLYVGTYCTVWTSNSDSSSIRLNGNQARQIGQKFDQEFPRMQNAFGSTWNDTDGDGKIALMCYDIDKNYGHSVSAYTAGYFWMRDMIDPQGYTDNLYFGAGYYTNGMDCLNIDTYPGMGNNLNNIPNCYGTLFHELQHLLNYSTHAKLTNEEFNSLGEMETYLNEAYSLAAEHMICGPSSLDSRADFYNSDDYVTGSALTCWYSDVNENISSDYTLSNYANSYLFSQYLRTRYDMLTGQGETIFQKALAMRVASKHPDTLFILANLLQTDKETLVADFWQAMFEQAPSGIYGFNNESWVRNFHLPYYSSWSSYITADNGGAQFYIRSQPYSQISTSSNLIFRSFSDESWTGPGIHTLTLERTSAAQVTAKVAPVEANTRLFYAFSDSPTLTKGSGSWSNVTLTDPQVVRNITSGTLRNDRQPYFYYYTQDSAGRQSPVHCRIVPAFSGTPLDQVSLEGIYPIAGQRATISYSVSGGCTLSQTGWYDVTDNGNTPLSTSDHFQEGRLYQFRTYVNAPQNVYFVDNIPGHINGKQMPEWTDGSLTYLFQNQSRIYLASKPAAAKAPMAFTDVPSGKWYTGAVTYVYYNGLMNGTSDTTFRPDATTTRAQLVQVLYNLEGRPGHSGNNPFHDVPNGKWFTAAIIWAVDNGITTGAGGGKFKPEDPVTREELVTFFYRYAQLKGYDTTGSSYDHFPDAYRVGKWHRDSMGWGVHYGIVSGNKTNGQLLLDPQGQANRAQIATILMRFCNTFQ